MKELKLGLIEGRHPMPVDKYLLPADITNKVGFHDGLYQAAYKAARKIRGSLVTLYPTGLTNAVLGAISGLQEDPDNIVIVASYDRDADDYQFLDLGSMGKNTPDPIEKSGWNEVDSL